MVDRRLSTVNCGQVAQYEFSGFTNVFRWCNISSMREHNILIVGDNKKKIIFQFLCGIIAVFVVTIVPNGCPGEAQAASTEKEFFLPDRFFLNTQVIDQMSSDAGTARDLQKFSTNFIDGVYLYSAGDFDKSKELNSD